MTKKTSFLFVAIFLLFIFSGCGIGQKNKPAQNSASAECAKINQGILKGDGGSDDAKLTCCFKEDLESGPCRPFELVFNTPDLGRVAVSLSQNGESCMVSVNYGGADQIIDPDKKFFAGKFISSFYPLADSKSVKDYSCQKNPDLSGFYNFPSHILDMYMASAATPFGSLDRAQVAAYNNKQVEKKCSGMNGLELKGDGSATDMDLACCYEQSYKSGSCFPFQMIFNTADLGPVTLSLINDKQNCVERLDFAGADKIIDPEKKFYANKNIIYTKLLSDAKFSSSQLSCQDRLKSAYGDPKNFYNLPSSLISQYWNGQLAGFSGNLVQGLVDSCSSVSSATISGDGSFKDNKGRCCFLENLYLNNCQPFKAVYSTPDLGKVTLSLSKSKKNCVARVDYGAADQITDPNKKNYANKYAAQIFTPNDLSGYAGTKDKTGVLLCQQIFSVYAGTSASDFNSIVDGYLKKQSGFSGNLVKSTVVEKNVKDSTKATAVARDQARVSYVKTIQQALKNYYGNNGKYPPSLSFGKPLVDSSGKKYLSEVSRNIFPNDGSCPTDSNFSYQSLKAGQSYSLTFCLGNATGNVPAGVNVATPENIIGSAAGSDHQGNAFEIKTGTSSPEKGNDQPVVSGENKNTGGVVASSTASGSGNKSNTNTGKSGNNRIYNNSNYIHGSVDVNNPSGVKLIQGTGEY
jgi:hypothetical protein